MGLTHSHFSSYVSKDTRAMKSIILSILLVGCALAEDGPYPPSGTRPQGALLVLPTELGSASENRPAPQYAAPQYLAPQVKPETENLPKANENKLEQLRQAQGADSGSYYVYLADGRLQRVQYVTAPLRQSPPQNNNQQVSTQNTQTIQNSHFLQFNQQNAQASAKLQNLGQDRSKNQEQEPYTYPEPSFNNQYQQAASAQYKQQLSGSQFQQKQPAFNQYKQQPSANQFNEEAASTQYSQQVPSGSYQQQQQKPEKLKQQPSSSQQYPQGSAQQLASNQYSKVAFQGASSNENPASAQQQLYPQQQQNQLELQQPEINQFALQQQVYQQPEQAQIAFQQQILQQPLAASYVASVQFTEVQPIATPIYSYTPTPLVRILRYAPRYQ